MDPYVSSSPHLLIVAKAGTKPGGKRRCGWGSRGPGDFLPALANEANIWVLPLQALPIMVYAANHAVCILL